jgi:hypothetical protein
MGFNLFRHEIIDACAGLASVCETNVIANYRAKESRINWLRPFPVRNDKDPIDGLASAGRVIATAHQRAKDVGA